MKLKVKVYIDGANIFYAQKKMGWMIDWEKVSEYLKKNYEVLETRFYMSVRKKDRKAKRFLDILSQIGFKIITKPLKEIKDEGKTIYKANFDVEITADMISGKEDVEWLILFSGDSDFEYLVKILKKLGKKVMVYSSRRTISWELKLAANKYFLFERLQKNLYRKKWGIDKDG